MKKSFIRTLIVFGLVLCLGLIASCGNKGGGETGGEQPGGNIGNEQKHEHVACPTCGLCTDSKCDGAASVKCAGHNDDNNSPTKWELNKIGFDGQGMNYVLKVLPVAEFDPFDAGFTGSKRALKQAHQKDVEDAYNINIEYSAWDNEAPWGPDRVKFIKTSFQDKSFEKKNKRN